MRTRLQHVEFLQQDIGTTYEACLLARGKSVSAKIVNGDRWAEVNKSDFGCVFFIMPFFRKLYTIVVRKIAGSIFFRLIGNHS